MKHYNNQKTDSGQQGKPRPKQFQILKTCPHYKKKLHLHLSDHKRHCDIRQCPTCKTKMPRREKDAHVQTCELLPKHAAGAKY